MSKTFEGKPCRKCGSTTRYNNKYKQCVACKQANNSKRTKEQRQQEYQTSEVGLLYSDRFQLDAVKRAGTTATLVSSKEQMLLRLVLRICRHRKLNGEGQKKAKWTFDHIYPQVGEIVGDKQRVGLTTLKNLRIISVEENKAKSNKIIGAGEYVEVELGSINRELKQAEDIRDVISNEINYDSKNNHPLDVHHPITKEEIEQDAWLEEENVNEIMKAYEDGFYVCPLSGEKFEMVAYDPMASYGSKTKSRDRATRAAWSKQEVEDFQSKINKLLEGQDLDEVEKALNAMLD